MVLKAGEDLLLELAGEDEGERVEAFGTEPQ